MTQLISLQPNEETRPLISIPRQDTARVVTPRAQDRDAAYYSLATNRDYEETRAYVENGWTSRLEAETQANAQTAVAAQAEAALELDPEEANQAIQGTIDELRQIELFSRFLPQSLSAALRANVTGSREMAVDRIARLVYTGEQIEQRLEAMGGVGPAVVDFTEVLVDPLDIVHQNTYRNLTTRYEALLAPGVSPQDFEAGLNEILNEAEDAGFFSSQNRFYFGSFLDTLANGVYSPQQLANESLAWLDVFATGAIEAIPLAVRGGRTLRDTTALVGTLGVSTGVVARSTAGAIIDAGRDYLSVFNLMQPSRFRQEIMNQVLESSITHDTARGIEPTRHTHYSVATPTNVRGGFLTAPEHEAARNLELRSTVLRDVRELAAESGRVFDDETIENFANQFTQDRIAYLREGGFTRIIDVEVGVDEFNNIVAMDIIGTTRGTTFRRQQDAARAAEFGDEVLQMPDGTWAIGRRNNISADNFQWLSELGYSPSLEGLMLYRATDPEALGDGFWARWGSPLAQADPETSSYLYRAESIMQRAMHQINARTKTITRGMRARHVSEVYQAFEYMASRPGRDAMTGDEFSAWFSSTFNREATDSQRALYLLQQERLDAELFITANEIYRRAVDLGARTVRHDGVEYVATRVTSPLPESALVFDTDLGRVVRASELGDTNVIYRNMSSTDIPGDVQYITGASLESRAVRHSDFLVRNAGGHRAYIVNQMQFLVKQRAVRTYADGTTREMAPNTLLGARTSDEAKRTVEDVSRIQDEIQQIVPVGRLSADEYLDAVEAAAGSRRLDDVVRANNGWNPEITNVQDLVDFARARGIDLRTRFEVVEEGAPLSSFARLDDNPFALDNATHADDVRMNILRGGRGTLPLTRYGGGTVAQRSTQDVIEGAYAASIARMTEAAYRIRAGQGLIKGAVDAGVMKAGWNDIRHLPLRTQLQRIYDEGLIDTSGASGRADNIGRKFQLDLERLMFRLRQRSHVAEIWDRTTRSLANYLYGKNFTWGVDKLDRRSTDPLTALRGWAFDAYLGMFSVSQLLMQSMQVVNIVGIAGTKGYQGAALYGPMRFLLNNGHSAVTQRVATLLRDIVGLDAEQFEDMLQMFRTSGRGIVDNNLAEMTMAEDAASNLGRLGINQQVRDVREAGRVFFKEGDLVARITAFNTAYLEAVERFGRRTAKNNSAFTRFVTWREQVLTQGMTAASRQGYEQFPFMQFMTYQLRINEALFAGTFSNSKTVLTRAEKTRLAFTHIAMFGAMSNTATGVLSQYIEANADIPAPEWVVRLAQRGMLDAALSAISGSDTAASSRFSSSMGLYNIMDQLAREHPALVLGGPSLQFGATAADTLIGTVYQGLRMLYTGNSQDFRTELTDLARLTSSGNSTYNALTAYRYGRYLTKRSGLVTDDLTQMDAVFIAFGIPLEEIDSIYSYIAQSRIRDGWLRHTADSITRMHNQAHEALRAGDRERYLYMMNAIGEIRRSLEPIEIERIDRMIRDEERSLVDSFMLDLARRDVEALEQVQ